MSDLTEQLKRLTPTSMDRDALFMKAAQAAVPRSSPVWKWLCGVLAGSQITMVTLWMMAPKATVNNITPLPAPTAISDADVTPTPIEPYSYLALNFREEPKLLNASPFSSDVSPTRPILTAGSRLRLD